MRKVAQFILYFFAIVFLFISPAYADEFTMYPLRCTFGDFVPPQIPINECGKTYSAPAGTHAISTITKTGNDTYVVTGKTLKPGTPLQVGLTYSYLRGSHGEVDHPETTIKVQDVQVEAYLDTDGKVSTLSSTAVDSLGNFTIQFQTGKLDMSQRVGLKSWISGNFSFTFTRSSNTFNYHAADYIGWVNVNDSKGTTDAAINHPNSPASNSSFLNEFISGFFHGSKITLSGLWHSGLTIINGLGGGLRLLGNGIAAAGAQLETLWNGKSFNENYQTLNMFGDAGLNANAVVSGLLLVGITALLIGGTALLAPVVGSAAIAGAIIGIVAAIISVGVGVGVHVQQGATVNDAFHEIACGKAKATVAYCAGSITGQIVTGELGGYAMGKVLIKVQDVLTPPLKVIIEPKIKKQMIRRGWTEKLIEETIISPFTIRKAMNKVNGKSATVFYNIDGSYVSKDDITGAIIQVSDKNRTDWIPDNTIINPYKP